MGAKMILMVYKPTYAGWWFGIFFMTFQKQLGMAKSSQLTNSYFSEG